MNLNWNAIEAEVRQTNSLLGPRQALFRDVHLKDLTDTGGGGMLARLSAKSKLSAGMFEQLLLVDVKRTLEARTGKNVVFEFEVESRQESFPVEEVMVQAKAVSEGATIRFRERLSLDPEMTFASFVATAETEFAVEALRDYARPAGAGFPLVVLHGPSGVGKSHLLHATGSLAKELFPGRRIKVVTGDDFITDFQVAIQKKMMGDFRKRYRLETDLLLIDDLHSVSRAKGTQEELFNLVNHYTATGRGLIVTCDKPIASLTGLEERLLSRLCGGLVLPIEFPSLQSRVEIVRAKLAARGIELVEESVRTLAESAGRCVRSLEGVVHRISLLARRGPVSLEMIAGVVGAPIARASRDPRELLFDVATKNGLSIDDLRGKSRTRACVSARHEAMRGLKALGLGFSEIGRLLQRDHSTVMAALRV